MVGNYKVITLCGSTRFKDAFMAAQKQLTLAGNIVISVGLFGHAGDSEVWEGMSEDTLTRTVRRVLIVEDEEYVRLFLEEFERIWEEFNPTRFSFFPQKERAR